MFFFSYSFQTAWETTKKILSVSDQFTFNSHSKRVACFQRFISITNGPFINTSIFYKKIWRKLKTDSSKKRGGRDQKDRGRSHTMFTRRGGWLVQKFRLFVNVYKLENVNARGITVSDWVPKKDSANFESNTFL